MITGQIIGGFGVSDHFFERWYERTEIPGKYFEIVVEEGVYILLGTDHKGSNHFMFSCPAVNSYYIFITADNTLKTLLTEKMYKNQPSPFDTQRAKKQLRELNRKMRIEWSHVKIIVNDVVVKEYDITKSDDVVMSRIIGLRQAAEDCEEMMSDMNNIMNILCDSKVPLNPIFKYEVRLADVIVKTGEIKLKPNFIKEVHNIRMLMQMPKNRKIRRMLKLPK